MVRKADDAPDMEWIEKAFSEEWDTERNAALIADLEMHLSKTNMYIPARLKEAMDAANQVPVVAVKTKTFIDSGKVWVAATTPSTPGARKLRSSKSMNGAYFGFAIPLNKLGIKLPADRKFNFKVTPIEVQGTTIYEISFVDFANVRRKIDEQKAAAARQAKSEKEMTRRQPKSV